MVAELSVQSTIAIVMYSEVAIGPYPEMRARPGNLECSHPVSRNDFDEDPAGAHRYLAIEQQTLAGLRIR